MKKLGDLLMAKGAARRLAPLVVVVAATVSVLSIGAASAGAAPPSQVIMGTASSVSYSSVHVTGEVEPGVDGGYFLFQYSTDGVEWSEGTAPSEISPGSLGLVPVEGDITGLHGGTRYFIRLAAIGPEEFNIFAVPSDPPYPEIETLFVEPPAVLTVDDATDVTRNTADVTGKVQRPANPDAAFDAECTFEYVTDEHFAESGFEFAVGRTGCEPEDPVTATDPVEVHAGLAGLAPGTTYHLRLTASNAGGADSVEAADTFTTEPVAPPSVLTADPAAQVANTSAIVSGSVERESNPDPAYLTECRFEYITDAGYKPRNEKQQIRVSASSGIYKLSFAETPNRAPKTTAPIAYNASAAAVQADLEALPNVGPGVLTVTGGPGSATGDSPYIISFIGSLAGRNIPQLDVPFENLKPLRPRTENTEVSTLTEGHAEGFEGAGATPCSVNPIEAGGVTPVSAELTGLSPNTEYHLRLSASNEGGLDLLEASNFTTTAVQIARTLTAGMVQATSAKLGGQVNAANAPLDYQFEWGVGSGGGYENVVPAAPDRLSVIDDDLHIVTVSLSGLTPQTAYHYRIVATDPETSEVVRGADRTFTTRAVLPASAPCSNETSRVGLSAGLPDCRAYEWVTPGSVGNAIHAEAAVGSNIPTDGGAIVFQTNDAVEDSGSNEAAANIALATRAADGWSTRSLMPHLVEQVSSYQYTVKFLAISKDLTQSVVGSKQRLAGSPHGGGNYYLHRPDGTYVLLTPEGGISQINLGCCVTSPDFSKILMYPEVAQLPTDPVNGGNVYEWVDGHLELLGYLPGGELAPQGVTLPSGRLLDITDDGSRVLFTANGLPDLYMRTDGQTTLNVSASQRTVDPDPNPAATVVPTGITGDGSTILFTSASELTDDANTGETGGVDDDSGSDLYSYDVASGELSDLTVDDRPGDAATGADVIEVTGASDDGSYVYFIATGDLAPGASAGEPNFYVEHEGRIDFIASAEGRGLDPVAHTVFYVTPDGKNAVFLSAAPLTAYDSVDPETGAPTKQLFKYTYGANLECASCRPSGEPPTGDANITMSRPISDDGSRVFFESDDMVVPGGGGVAGVYEYENGQVHLISPSDSHSAATFLGADSTGDEVFFFTYGELTPQGQGKESAIYDARVDAAPDLSQQSQCRGEGCRGMSVSPPAGQAPGSTAAAAPRKVGAAAPRSVRAGKLKLRLDAPAAGVLTVSGNGVHSRRLSVAKAGQVTTTVVLKPSANSRRHRKGTFKTQIRISFYPDAGAASDTYLGLTFKGSGKHKGKGGHK